MSKQQLEKNWLEWTVFALSSVLLVAVFAVLIYDVSTRTNKPPDLHIEVGAGESSSAGFVVPVSVTNRGDETAMGVEIEITSQTSEDKNEIEFAFVPRGGSRTGFVVFEKPTAASDIKARIVGFETP